MSGKDIRESVGLLLVVASMVFVGMEIQQNTRLARAETRQAIVDDSFQFILSRATNPDMNRQIREWQNSAPGEAFDCEDRYSEACIFVFGVLRYHENIFIQVREGVVDDAVFLSYGWSNNLHYRSLLFPELWESLRGSFDPEFVGAFEAEYDLAS